MKPCKFDQERSEEVPFIKVWQNPFYRELLLKLDTSCIYQESNGNSTTKVNLISSNNNMLKNHFPKNVQLKPKKRAFKNNNRPQGRGNPNKNYNKNQEPPSQDQFNRSCFVCGKSRHIARFYKFRKREFVP